jgi:hypothetical protein
MRELTMSEVSCVSGGTDESAPGVCGNNYGGITETGSVGQDLIDFYEGLVEATSYIIERVATSV